jgi:hypothetical protein
LSENQPTDRGNPGDAASQATPGVAGVVPSLDEAPATYEAGRAGPDPTVGTGSLIAIGCVVLVLVAMAVLAAVFFIPFVGR